MYTQTYVHKALPLLKEPLPCRPVPTPLPVVK